MIFEEFINGLRNSCSLCLSEFSEGCLPKELFGLP